MYELYGEKSTLIQVVSVEGGLVDDHEVDRQLEDVHRPQVNVYIKVPNVRLILTHG